MLSAFAICETMNFLASASALPLSPSSFQQHSIQRLNLLKTSGCKPTNFLLLRYLCKLTFSWGELRGEDANKRNVVCLTPLQKKLQFSSQDEKYVGWTFWRWGGANLRISFFWGIFASSHVVVALVPWLRDVAGPGVLAGCLAGPQLLWSWSFRCRLNRVSVEKIKILYCSLVIYSRKIRKIDLLECFTKWMVKWSVRCSEKCRKWVGEIWKRNRKQSVCSSDLCQMLGWTLNHSHKQSTSLYKKEKCNAVLCLHIPVKTLGCCHNRPFPLTTFQTHTYTWPDSNLHTETQNVSKPTSSFFAGSGGMWLRNVERCFLHLHFLRVLPPYGLFWGLSAT